VAPPVQVRGDVLMLTGESIVVKSSERTSTLTLLGKDSTLDPVITVGDRF
jgi:hypothetical protein